MLVLSRKKGESIRIGNDIEIKVIAVEGDQIKLGIVAPKNISVHRSEIYEAIQQQNAEAIKGNMGLLKQLNKKNN